MLFLAALAPACLAAAHLGNVADAAHDAGVARAMGLQAQPWRGSTSLVASALRGSAAGDAGGARSAGRGTRRRRGGGGALRADAAPLPRLRGRAASRGADRGRGDLRRRVRAGVADGGRGRGGLGDGRAAGAAAAGRRWRGPATKRRRHPGGPASSLSGWPWGTSRWWADAPWRRARRSSAREARRGAALAAAWRDRRTRHSRCAFTAGLAPLGSGLLRTRAAGAAAGRVAGRLPGPASAGRRTRDRRCRMLRAELGVVLGALAVGGARAGRAGGARASAGGCAARGGRRWVSPAGGRVRRSVRRASARRCWRRRGRRVRSPAWPCRPSCGPSRTRGYRWRAPARRWSLCWSSPSRWTPPTRRSCAPSRARTAPRPSGTISPGVSFRRARWCWSPTRAWDVAPPPRRRPVRCAETSRWCRRRRAAWRRRAFWPRMRRWSRSGVTSSSPGRPRRRRSRRWRRCARWPWPTSRAGGERWDGTSCRWRCSTASSRSRAARATAGRPSISSRRRVRAWRRPPPRTPSWRRRPPTFCGHARSTSPPAGTAIWWDARWTTSTRSRRTIPREPPSWRESRPGKRGPRWTISVP